MFRPIITVFLSVLYASLTAQVIGYVDSVEVHRTDTIYFDFGSFELTDAATAAVATLVADRPAELELYLEGHTDAVGSARANAALAQRREALEGMEEEWGWRGGGRLCQGPFFHQPYDGAKGR